MEKLVGDSVLGPRETELPQLFCCRLEEQPDHLVAGRYLTSQAGPQLANACLLVNPECVFTQDGESPDQFSGTPWLFSNFDLKGLGPDRWPEYLFHELRSRIRFNDVTAIICTLWTVESSEFVQHLYFRFAQIIGIKNALFRADVLTISKLAPSIPKRKLLLCAQASFTVRYESVFWPFWVPLRFFFLPSTIVCARTYISCG